MSGTPWFDEAFGPWYEAIYPHRSEAEARRIWGAMADLLPPGARLLDIGCGAGRHMSVLKEKGFDVVGLDRSPHLLRAAAVEHQGALVRADMRRVPFGPGSFEGAVCMFTTFGYFNTREDHRSLLGEWRRVLSPGGVLVLDYLNPDYLAAGLRAESERREGEYVIHESRRILPGAQDDVVHKQVEVRRGKDVVTRYTEAVTLYPPAVVQALAVSAGWKQTALFGDYQKGAYSSGSPRSVFVLEAA